MENAAVQQSRQALQTAIRIAKATRSQVRQAGQQAANAAEKAAADAAVKAAADAVRAHTQTRPQALTPENHVRQLAQVAAMCMLQEV